jgi:hypothetical protein
MLLKSVVLTCSVAAIITSAWPAAVGQQPGLPPGDQRVIADFNRKVSEYVELHRRLEGPVPTIQVSSDPGETRGGMAALARKIRAERIRARQGDFFTPAAGPVFRRLIAAGCGGDLEGLHAIANEENPYVTKWHPRVNALYPDHLPFSMMPPSVLCSLPALPEELQFRFWDRSLLLWDYHANLIVDILPDALPST